MSATLAAVDIGASSGRVIAGRIDDGQLRWQEMRRFTNTAVELPTTDGPRLYWDALRLFDELSDGLLNAAQQWGPLAGIGIDTWAVDYGLLTPSGQLVGQVACYRSDRNHAAAERFFEHVSPAELYAQVGLQYQPFNTVFQLLADEPALLQAADRMLLLPDLLSFWLSGQAATEVTNASTTGLLDPRTRDWSPTVLGWQRERLGLDVEPLLTELVEPGTVTGELTATRLEACHSPDAPTRVIAVGSHDTASAVAAVPASEANFAYLSCGTWSLVGLELDRPVLSEQARGDNLTNELGIDGTVRFLKNVMGLWVFNEAVRTWRERGLEISVPELVRQAAEVELGRTVVDINDDVFFAPGDMPDRIRDLARRTEQPIPESPAEVTRCILDSLALAYRGALHSAMAAADRDVDVLHMVGGGIQNELLCQLTADALNLPVVAGPVEGTALGNLVVQARALSMIDGELAQLREVVARSSELRHYRPDPDRARQFDQLQHKL